MHTILERLENCPVYFRAARASIVDPSCEHTALAIIQLPAALTLLDEIGKATRSARLGSAGALGPTNLFQQIALDHQDRRWEWRQLQRRSVELTSSVSGYSEIMALPSRGAQQGARCTIRIEEIS